MHSFIHKTC